MGLRDVFLRIEPWLLAASGPLLRSSKARVQRSVVAQKYLRGKGAEIGAFIQPIVTPRGCHTAYIDRVPKSHWDDHEEYKQFKIVDVDIVDDGLHLSKVETHAFDYLIAAHVLEHADDPIQAMKNWVRVVKPGGHLLVIVPDKRFTFDKDRELTTIDHFLKDHQEGPACSAPEHYREIAIKCMGLSSAEEIEAYVQTAEPAVHFHTWTLDSFVEFLLVTNRYLGDVFEIVEAKLNVGEDLCVLRIKETGVAH